MTDETPENQPSHVEKHAMRTTAEIDPYKLRVKFSPQMQKTLLEVIAEVERVGRSESEPLTRRLLPNLQELSSGKVRLVKAMQLMGDITKGLNYHSKTTGDYGAEATWGQFVAGMYRHHPTLAKPFTLTQDKARGATQSMA